MVDSDKAIAPDNEQSGGSSMIDKAPDDIREFLKNKLPEGVSDEEAFLKVSKDYMNAEKLIGRKEDAIIDSLFDKKDSRLMQALKGKEQPEVDNKEEPKAKETPAQKGGELTQEEARMLLQEIMGGKNKEIEEKQNNILQQLSESEKRMQAEKLEQQVTQLDNSYKELISQIPEEEVGEYVKPILNILWNEKTGKPREDAGLFYKTRNPVTTALQFYLSATGANPELLSKLSKPIYTEGGGVNMPAGKASRKSPTDRAFDEAVAADKELDLYKLNRK